MPPPAPHSVYKKGAVATGLATLFTMGGGFAALFLANRVLGKELFASYAFATSAIFFAGVLFSAGLERVLIYRLSQRQQGSTPPIDVAGPLITVAIVLGCIGVVLTFGLAGVVGRMVQLPQVETIVRIVSPMVLILPLLWITSEWRRAHDQYQLAFAVPAASEMLRAVGLGALVITGGSLGAAGVVTVVSLLIPLIILTVARPRVPVTFALRLSTIDAMYGVQSMATRLLREAANRAGLLLLGVFATAPATADFAVASRLALALLVAQTMLTASFGPRVTTLLSQNNAAALQAELEKTRLISTALGLTGALGLVVLGKWCLAIFGDYSGAYGILMILSAAFLSDVIAGPGVLILAMSGDARSALWIRGLALVVLLGGCAALIPPLGGMGLRWRHLALRRCCTPCQHVAVQHKTGLIVISRAVAVRLAIAVLSLLCAALMTSPWIAALGLAGLLGQVLWALKPGIS